MDNFAHLNDSQSQALFDIETRYYCEAQKCQQIGAYLAGCVMLGAALEANLMAMATFQSNEMAAWYKEHHKAKSVKPLLDWNLGKLLAVANALGWLPESETVDDDPKTWQIGTYALAVRMLRNLIHPGRYVKDFPGFQFTSETLSASFNVLDGVYLHLHAALSAKVQAEQQSNS